MTDAYVPLTGPPAWPDALCLGDPDPELWQSDSPDGKGHGVDPVRIAIAKTICSYCPRKAQCLEDADEYGIWGGTTAEERSVVTVGACKHGHPWTPTNTAYKEGRRACRRCQADREAARKARTSYGTATCPTCHQVFTLRRETQQYCSKTCAIAVNRGPGGRPRSKQRATA